MSNEERRSFSREFKLKVIKRLEAGESGSALALELSLKRTIIYRWRDAWRKGGPEALCSTRRRPPKLEALVKERARGVAAKAIDLTEAPRQIAELQRKMGQQAAGSGFFQASLAAHRGVAPAEHRSWRDGVFAQIQAMTHPQGEGSAQSPSIERMCALGGVSRASFHWLWSSARAHLEGRDDGLIAVARPRERESDRRAFLYQGLSEDQHQATSPIRPACGLPPCFSSNAWRMVSFQCFAPGLGGLGSNTTP